MVPPGVYSDVGLFVDLLKYNTQAYQFSAADPEVITQDNQRIGVTVSGSVLRPTLVSATMDELISYWVQYQSVYTSDTALQKVAEDLSFQSMKVCVGDRPFTRGGRLDWNAIHQERLVSQVYSKFTTNDLVLRSEIFCRK